MRRLWATHQPKNRPWLDLSRKGVNDGPQVLLGVLAAILIIGLVVPTVYFVVWEKKENVDASSGGLGGSPIGIGIAATTTHFGNGKTHNSQREVCSTYFSTIIVQHVTNQGKSASRAYTSA
jgi:hypothetical protein